MNKMMRRAKTDEERCEVRAELTPNSVWRCKWPKDHEGPHHYERIGWTDT